MMSKNVLIIEDNEEERGLYARVLNSEGYQVIESPNLIHAKATISRHDIQVVILDVNLPDGNGLDFIPELKRNQPGCEVIIFTSQGDIHDGVRSIKQGAFDYLLKGEHPMKLLAMVDKAMQLSVTKVHHSTQEKSFNIGGLSSIIGNSAAIIKAKEMAARVSPTSASVLLLGETGVGKDLFAEAIHQSSSRKGHEFIAINCSSIGKEMLESELFGYKAGAFTGANKDKKGLFEMANKGTVFLDEIGEMSIELQSRILRVLQNRSFIKLGDTRATHVDCRLIAATNVDLVSAVQKGTFREDLYYRISSFVIKIPPLRERDKDLMLLAEHFVHALPKKLGLPPSEITPDFLNALSNHQWTGNVRELINVVERALILSDGKLTADLLEFSTVKKMFSRESLHDIEYEHIQGILAESGGNKRMAARKLGISISKLYRRLNK